MHRQSVCLLLTVPMMHCEVLSSEDILSAVGCSDVHCGRIQCQGGRDRPLLGTNAEIITTTVRFNHSDLVCRGTFFHLGDDVSDPATVAQGVACGPGKVRYVFMFVNELSGCLSGFCKNKQEHNSFKCKGTIQVWH